MGRVADDLLVSIGNDTQLSGLTKLQLKTLNSQLKETK
jgi:hypothetical protein